MNNVYIIGAGGEGHVFADVVMAAGLKVGGFFDDRVELVGKEVMGARVLGRVIEARKYEGQFLISVGDNRKRKEIFEKLGMPIEKFATVFHPFSHRGIGFKTGNDSIFLIGSLVGTQVSIGNHVIVSLGTCISHHNIIEDYAFVGPNSCTGGNVHIKEGAFIGIGASIIPNITIGRWAIVGAGSVVIRDVPDFATVVGNPARVIKYREEGQL